jgi:hypothetical protein
MRRMRNFMMALSWVLGASPALSQAGPPATTARPPEPGAASAEVSCAGTPIYWAGSGPEVRVLRRGTIDQRSPLAPQDEALLATVLEVSIRGKAAATYGPSFHEMRRAGPPYEVEQQFGAAIQWESELAGLPHEILLVGDDGADVVARLRFVKCVARPKPRPARERAAPSRPTEAPAAAQQRPPIAVPQGAIQ